MSGMASTSRCRLPDAFLLTSLRADPECLLHHAKHQQHEKQDIQRHQADGHMRGNQPEHRRHKRGTDRQCQKRLPFVFYYTPHSGIRQSAAAILSFTLYAIVPVCAALKREPILPMFRMQNQQNHVSFFTSKRPKSTCFFTLFSWYHCLTFLKKLLRMIL